MVAWSELNILSTVLLIMHVPNNFISHHTISFHIIAVIQNEFYSFQLSIL